MFEIGEIVVWEIGTQKMKNKGIFHSCQGEFTTVMSLEINGLPCRRKMPVLTELLKKEEKEVGS